jgi:hypothetical protein
MPARFALPVVAFALAFAARPALAACTKLCDETYDLGGSAADEHVMPQAAHHHTPVVEMSLPGYLWTKLCAEAHAAADKAAFALITATSRLAVVAAREKQEHDAATPAPAPQPAPTQGQPAHACPYERHEPPV